MADEEDVSNEALTIKVKETSGEEMQFKVKKNTRMEKIFEAYASRKGIQSSSLKFMLDGNRILKEHTPKMLELEDNDQIDVFLEQVGGADDGDEASQAITIKVKDGAGEELQFKVKKSTRMEKIFEAYAGRKGISSASLRFSLDGEKINPDATPKMLELEDNDQIDVFLQQTGGHV